MVKVCLHNRAFNCIALVRCFYHHRNYTLLHIRLCVYTQIGSYRNCFVDAAAAAIYC